MFANFAAKRFLTNHGENMVHLSSLDKDVLYVQQGYTVVKATFDDRETLSFSVHKETFEALAHSVKFAVCDELRRRHMGTHFFSKCCEVDYWVAEPKQGFIDEARINIAEGIAAVKDAWFKHNDQESV